MLATVATVSPGVIAARAPSSPSPKPPAPLTRSNSRTYRPKLRQSTRQATAPPVQTRRRRVHLSALIQDARIFARLLCHMDWRDFMSFANTCHTFRTLFDAKETRNAILCRFVPGYAQCWRQCDLQQLKEVDVTLHDLHIFQMALSVPLHRYPMHALSCLSEMSPFPEQHNQSERLVRLALAYSRFVLLVQSLAHSTSTPPPPETEDFRPSRRTGRKSGVRELTFPAPLACEASVPVAAPAPSIMSVQSARSLSSARSSRRKSSGSLFRHKDRNLPPPTEPLTLKYYTNSWRRTIVHSSAGATSDDEDDFVPFRPGRHSLATIADDAIGLPKPPRRFSSLLSSTESSLSTSASPSSISSSASPSPPFFGSPAQSASPVTTTSIGSSVSALPHDFLLATSRSRAPVLRVFVPCDELSDDALGVQRCEDQLIRANLWEHLSAGDVVCNLGYIPRSTGSTPRDSDDELNVDATAGARGSKWLLFNGQMLVVYVPTVDVLPLADPLSLPSPFYYTHLGGDTTFRIPRLPPCNDVPQLRLVSVSVRVRSPHSPGGFAMVRRPAWTARVFRQDDDRQQMGAAWFGEWVLQGEGTREGRQVLLDCLSGYDLGPVDWAFCREKSGAGRIWLKLLHSSESREKHLTDYFDSATTPSINDVLTPRPRENGTVYVSNNGAFNGFSNTTVGVSVPSLREPSPEKFGTTSTVVKTALDVKAPPNSVKASSTVIAIANGTKSQSKPPSLVRASLDKPLPPVHPSSSLGTSLSKARQSTIPSSSNLAATSSSSPSSSPASKASANISARSAKPKAPTKKERKFLIRTRHAAS